ncbi:MAG: hypothetical protein AAF986_09450 [Pseudomonadota bacterium]
MELALILGFQPEFQYGTHGAKRKGAAHQITARLGTILRKNHWHPQNNA